MIRVPLQVGASSLRNLVIGGGLLVPGVVACWLEVSVLGSGVPVVGIVGLGMTAFGAVSLRNAWRERPSDLLFGDEAMQVEGGALNRFALRWDAIKRVTLAEHEDRGQVLTVEAADGTRTVLARSDDPAEIVALRDAMDALLARATLRGEGPSAPASPDLEAKAALVRQPTARMTTASVALGLLFLASAWPATAIALRRIDGHGTWSTGSFFALLAVPLLLLADGYFLARVWLIDRHALGSRAARARERRKWFALTLATLPLFACTWLAAKKVARQSADESATALAHGFEANAPPLAPLAPAPGTPKDAHDVQMIRTKHGDALSYVVDAAGGSTLFLDGKPILETKDGNLARAPSFDKGASRFVYTAVSKAGETTVKALLVERGELADETAQEVVDRGVEGVWSPAGDHLAFTARSGEGTRVGVVATPTLKDPPYANSGFGPVTWVTGVEDHGQSPAWSPDGSGLAFASAHGVQSGHRQVFLVDARAFDKPPQQLTQGDADCSALRWTTDGWIRFDAQGRTQRVRP